MLQKTISAQNVLARSQIDIPKEKPVPGVQVEPSQEKSVPGGSIWNLNKEKSIPGGLIWSAVRKKSTPGVQVETFSGKTSFGYILGFGT